METIPLVFTTQKNPLANFYRQTKADIVEHSQKKANLGELLVLGGRSFPRRTFSSPGEKFS
jgi:hypothetical protein